MIEPTDFLSSSTPASSLEERALSLLLVSDKEALEASASTSSRISAIGLELVQDGKSAHPGRSIPRAEQMPPRRDCWKISAWAKPSVTDKADISEDCKVEMVLPSSAWAEAADLVERPEDEPLSAEGVVGTETRLSELRTLKVRVIRDFRCSIELVIL
jgi:hypothetical protein